MISGTLRFAKVRSPCVGCRVAVSRAVGSVAAGCRGVRQPNASFRMVVFAQVDYGWVAQR